MIGVRVGFLMLLLAALAARPSIGQEPDTTWTEAAPIPSVPGPWRPLRIAKWATLGAAVGTASHGFVASLAADDRIAELDRLCAAEPVRCEGRRDDGGYADEEAAELHDRARSLDRRARRSLLVSQVAILTSVALFLLDLKNTAPPVNVPYEPTRLRIEPGKDGGLEFSLRVVLPTRPALQGPVPASVPRPRR